MLLPVRNVGYGGVSDGFRQIQCICRISGCPRWLQADLVHMWDMGVSQMVACRPNAYVGYGGVSDCCRQTQCICGIWGCLRWLQADPVHIFLTLMQEALKKRIK